MRLSWRAAGAGVLIAAVGAAGLIRGAVPQAIATGPGNTGADPIVVSGAFVRPPVPPASEAAAYFTVYNTTDRADTLLSVATGAGATAVLHTVVDGQMTAVEGGVPIPAHGSLVLSVGKGHVMIGQLFGPLRAGQTVNLELTFATAGPIEVVAPVVPFGSGVPR
ncbi:MAG: periplasmic copper chaperone [Pseudonocardiales bacterium]|jgi:copper(I)-binding protein|nr:periplasmic copper chaperone [Pseudonocardiales bacterium]